MRLLPELQGSRGDCQGPAAALSRLHVVSLVCVRILYRSVYRQGAPAFLPSLSGAGCRCWTLPRAPPAELPMPGCSDALIALVPPFPARAGTAHPPCLLSLTPNPPGAAHSLSPLPARAGCAAGAAALGLYPYPAGSVVFMYRPATIKSASFLPAAVPAVPPSLLPPHARRGPALGPHQARRHPLSLPGRAPRSGRRRDDDDGAQQDLRAEARQVPAGGGWRVLHDRLRGAARAGAGPGPGWGAQGADRAEGAGVGPGDAGPRPGWGMWEAALRASKGRRRAPARGERPSGPQVPCAPSGRCPSASAVPGNGREQRSLRAAPGTRTGTWAPDPLGTGSSPDRGLRPRSRSPRISAHGCLRGSDYFMCCEAANPAPGPLGSGTAPKSAGAAPSALCSRVSKHRRAVLAPQCLC